MKEQPQLTPIEELKDNIEKVLDRHGIEKDSAFSLSIQIGIWRAIREYDQKTAADTIGMLDRQRKTYLALIEEFSD